MCVVNLLTDLGENSGVCLQGVVFGKVISPSADELTISLRIFLFDAVNLKSKLRVKTSISCLHLLGRLSGNRKRLQRVPKIV